MEFFINPESDDSAALLDLINRAYRGVDGERRWTTEQHLVTGDRLQAADLQKMLADSDLDWVIARQQAQVVGCIVIKYDAEYTEFGTFAVEPALHGSGLGKALLQFAEDHARARSAVFQVTVVEQNQNLVQFYQRRGYEHTGVRIPYPVTQNVGIPKQPDIELVLLRKPVKR